MRERRRSSEEEPIYENVVRVDNVQIIDHRIIRIAKRVHEAPRLIQDETEKFVSYIDKLKRLYVQSIVKRAKAERRYSEAISRYEFHEQELRAFDQNYLVQFEEDMEQATRNIELSHVELILARNILNSSERELLIHREQLCLLSKKAEHSYVFFLRKTADRYWADMYTKDLNDYDLDPLPPQFIYQQELTQPNTESLESGDSEGIVTSEEGFEWDTTYDDHFHGYHQIPNEDFISTESSYHNDFSEDNTTIEPQGSIHFDEISFEKTKLYTPTPLYDEFMIYRRRCALVQLMKPRRLIRYLKNVVHGPWEGWEDL